MKHPAAAIIALLIAINITAQTDTTTVSDEELFRWLDTYGTTTASDSTTTTNTADTTAANTDTIPRPDTQPADTTINVNALITNAFSKSKKRNDKTTSKTTETKKQPTKRTTKKTQPDKTPRPIIPDIPLEKAQLITAEDSTITHREALATAASNPLFLDWVACAPPHKTKDLFDQDSTITALRNSSSKYISRTTPELFDYHISQLPKSSEIKSKKLKSADAKKLALQTKEYLKVSKNATIQLEGYQKPK